MHPSVEQLLKVQGIDSEMRFLREAMRLRPQELGDERKRLVTSKAAAEATQEEIRKLRMEVDKGELEIKGCDAEIEKANITLNTVKNNQEYAVLKAQICRLKEEQGVIEEHVLTELTELDQLGGRRDVLEKALAEEEKTFSRREAEVSEVIQGLQGQVDKYLERREAYCADIDREHLALYGRILAHHGDTAISLVKDKICQGCHMTITSQNISMLMLGKELLQCKNCSRLLYLE